MNPLKKLAGQTLTYGMSSILVRVLNFFLVPLYSYILPPAESGSSTELLAYIALFQVVLTFGFETGFFRFASKHKEQAQEVFSTAVIFLGSVSLLFVLLVSIFSSSISVALGYPVHVLIFVSLILALDTFTAIFFAYLRFLDKAFRFVTYRTIKILTELGCNLLMFLVMPYYFKVHPHSFLLHFVSPTPSYDYIIFSILISCIVCFILFLPSIIRVKYIFSKPLFRQLFTYSFPLMIAGLPGVANDTISRLFFRYLAPDTSPWKDQLGIFGMNAKLAVFIVLFVQMFRYAAEPFFFSHAEKENIKKTYADVMKYFVFFCVVMFLGIAFYRDIIVLLLGKSYRIGVRVLPLMLITNILLGIVFNLSMWYKLSGQTKYAVTITLLGLIVNTVFNIIYMPRYGDMAAAWGYMLSYLAMVIYSALLGHKYYPIPYDWRKIIFYFASGVVIFVAGNYFSPSHALLKYSLYMLYIFIYIFIVMKMEHIDLKMIKKVIVNR